MVRIEPAVRDGERTLPRVLAVEDELAVVRHWERVLTGHCTVVHAESVEMAWARTEPEVWRLAPCEYVFLDMRLPDGSGADLLDRLNALLPRPAIAVVSGYLDAQQVLSLHGRCAICVPKPASRDVLLAILSLLRAARLGLSPIADFALAHALSPQETRLLLIATRDASNEEAAAELCCSSSTVRSYWARIFAKTSTHSVREVIVRLFHFAMNSASHPVSGPMATGVPLRSAEIPRSIAYTRAELRDFLSTRDVDA